MIEEIEAVAAAAVHSSSSNREGRDMVLDMDVDVVGSVHSMGGRVCLSVVNHNHDMDMQYIVRGRNTCML